MGYLHLNFKICNLLTNIFIFILRHYGHGHGTSVFAILIIKSVFFIIIMVILWIVQKLGGLFHYFVVHLAIFYLNVLSFIIILCFIPIFVSFCYRFVYLLS